jgi:glyoxylase-like metal-dependent hydrolase (beta-lactamase superfamily II)
MTDESHRFKVGTFECIVVNDGDFTYEHPAHVFFANAPPDRLARALGEHGLSPETWQEYVSPYPSLVINTGQHRVLVDTGADGLGPATGKLIPNLQAAGTAPEDIDTVILTHAHPDHIGGTVDSEGKPAFPNARYVMWKAEWEFWTAAPDLSGLQVPDWITQVLLKFAAENLPPIESQLDLVDAETEIVPGIHAIAAPGHTPGHMAVSISSDGQRLLCTGDVALHPIHLTEPDWYAAVDLAPDQALASRRRFLDMAVAEQALVQAFHFPFPGLGHVVQKGNAWQWQPIEAPG